ncbi:MAG: ACT domain-containing protein [Christensenellales bacterium]
MKLKKINFNFTICKVKSIQDIALAREIFFIGKTEEEISLVCKTEDTPLSTLAREDGWRGFRIQGILDFSLTGVLSKLSSILAERDIGIFAISTYNTDYILVKAEDYDNAIEALKFAGYEFE